MALRQSDIQIHNNPNLAVVDSDFVKGGFRTAVAVKSDLYALSGKTDEPSAAGQLKEYATIVYVTGEMKYYVLVDVDNVDNVAGWEEFVAGGAGTLTGATNGLSVSGKDVVLGGSALTGDTSILFSGTTQQIIIADTINGVGFFAGCNTGSDPSTIMYGSLSSYISITSGATDIVQNNGFEETNIGIYSSEIKVNSNASGFAGIEYGFDFSPNYTLLSLITYKDLTGATSGITGTITGGTNGLGEIGKDVCLGGTLLNNTTINPNGYDLNLSGTTGEISLFIGNAVSYSNLLVNNSISGITCGGNILLSSKCVFGSGGGKMIIEASSGASYAADYSLCNLNNPRWIPDKEYVDNADSIVNVRCFADTCTTVATDYYIGVVTGFSSAGGDFVCLIDPPSIGQKVVVTDMCGNALSDPIIIDAGSKYINGLTYNQSVINTCYGSITFIYNGLFWSATAFVN